LLRKTYRNRKNSIPTSSMGAHVSHFFGNLVAKAASRSSSMEEIRGFWSLRGRVIFGRTTARWGQGRSGGSTWWMLGGTEEEEEEEGREGREGGKREGEEGEGKSTAL
jgi:hypothetical protein